MIKVDNVAEENNAAGGIVPGRSDLAPLMNKITHSVREGPSQRQQ